MLTFLIRALIADQKARRMGYRARYAGFEGHAPYVLTLSSREAWQNGFLAADLELLTVE